MNLDFRFGLKAILLLFFLSPALSVQSFAFASGSEVFEMQPPADVVQQDINTNTVTYTSIDLSDPAVYAGEQFRIFVGLQNTGKKSLTHTVTCYRKDKSAPGGKILMSSKQLTLTAGQATEVEFKLAPENLLVKGRVAPESFVFVIGGQEIEVDYVK